MIKIDYRIMGVPSRLENTHLLQKSLGINDDKVFLDTEYRHNPMWTWKQTVSIPIEDDVTHLCIIQDDAILCNDFKKFCEYLVNRFPNNIWSLYNHQNLDYRFPKGCIVRFDHWAGGVVFIIPIEYISKIIEFHETECKDNIHDDFIIMYWAHMNNVMVYSTYPTVVDTFEESEMEHEAKHVSYLEMNPLKRHWIDATKYCIAKNYNWKI